MADALVRAGAQVAVTGRDRGRAEVVAAELGGGASGSASTSVIRAVGRAGVDAVVDRFGGIDLLVCNAGIGQRTVNPDFLSDPEPFWTAAPDAFGDVVDDEGRRVTFLDGAGGRAARCWPRRRRAGRRRSR